MSSVGIYSGQAATDQFRISAQETKFYPTRSQLVPPLRRATAQKRGWGIFHPLATAVVASAVSIAVTKSWSEVPVHAAAEQSESIRIVQVDWPALATTSSVVLPATVRPWQSTTLVARVSGYLKNWNADLGTRVKSGQLLAEIETPELDQELAEAKAQALEAEAAAVQAKAEREEAKADLKVAEAQLERVQADADLASSLFTRREKLVSSRSVSREELDTFQKQAEAKLADLHAAKSDVSRRRTNLQTRQAIIDAREATAKSRQANVERLKEVTGFKRIVAPFDGIVTRRSAEVGMLVTAGKESLFTVEDMSRVRVQANVPQAYSSQTKTGVAAMVAMPESTTPAVRGNVTRIADSVDSVTRTMLAEIEMDNAGNRFQPGSYVQITLDLPQNSSAWTVPSNTVIMRVDGPHIAVVDGKSQVDLRAVTLGRNLGNRVVVNGIRGDEELVVNPSDDLASGAKVNVSNPDRVTAVAQR